MTPDFERDGARHFPAVIPPDRIAAMIPLADRLLAGRPGARVTDRAVWEAFAVQAELRDIAAGLIGAGAQPVRVLAFDKTPEVNWALPWHQDRTIAVRKRIETPGFGPWSVKDGIPHVEPPTALLAGMVTLRLHLDDVDGTNAPLLVALGSPRRGLVVASAAPEIARNSPQLACLARAGDVWACSTLILHASDRQREPGHRRVIQVDYSTSDLPGGLAWFGFTQ